ncbi:type II toxin-antitoxin system PemK/MazF family toxin [Nocardioides sp.]|uniref:type II toxin-antitoxin system PemK/MazF family toxin n=1 Tax=Nocardioides sp. TaxID=35761 RepID=UPI003783B1DE
MRSLRRLFRRRDRAAAGRAAPGSAAPGGVQLGYAPVADGRPDPGEVVWAWVPFEDDPTQGKDRPVLLVGRDGDRLLGLMLTSKDHDRDAAQEARWGRQWMDVGVGAWDRERRPSEVRLDRLIELEVSGVRREGAALDRAVFDQVVAAARRLRTFDR